MIYWNFIEKAFAGIALTCFTSFTIAGTFIAIDVSKDYYKKLTKNK